MKKRIELFRLSDDNTWDTIIVSVDAKASTDEIEKKVIPGLMSETRHRSVVLMGIYNDCLEQDEPTGDSPETEAQDRKNGLYGPDKSQSF